jgi:molybdopterin-guanine dinucleotide biosynthesis protein A
MMTRDSMLVLGSAGRNVGKTEFACRLIARYAAIHTVVGVKITTVKERDGKCPRGGEGCGVCTSLQGNYAITEEVDGPVGKDTTRMLEAGAHKVYWLRVLKEHLEEGVANLLEIIPEEAVIVCESNSLRQVLTPGMFLVVREKGSDAIKASCKDVIRFADRVFEFDGTDWDFFPEQCIFSNGQWQSSPRVGAVILAGGKSRRMGQDKSMMLFNGVPMIQHIAGQLKPWFSEIMIGANDAEKYAFLGLPVVHDEVAGQGPLMGILSCVAQSPCELVFVTGCDIPHMQLEFVQHLISLAEGHDIVMPRWPDGRKEPLLALYRKSIVQPARAIIAAGGRRIIDLLEHLDVRFAEMPDADWYHNLNTRADFDAASHALADRKENSRAHI